MDLFVLGTSQSVASAEERERLHVDLEELYGALFLLRGVHGLLDEALPLLTCGRMELYGVSERPKRALRLLRELAAERTGVPAGELAARSYALQGADAVRHLFRVASGLDSVIHGEAQILGQVRDALGHPHAAEMSGPWLQRLFQSALATGKRVRAETEIGRGAASVASASLALLERAMGPLDGSSAVVLGAGDTGALMARLLRKRGVGRLVVANRTRSRAEALARELGGEAAGLDDLRAVLAGADVVVGAVLGRPDLVGPAELPHDPASPRRRFLLDLAHPRNFDPALASLEGVRIIDLEHVFRRVDSVLEARATQVPRAEAIVDEEVERFQAWSRSRASLAVLRAVREQVMAMAEREAERRSRGRSEADREAMQRFARSLARTLLHPPTVALREADPASTEGQWLMRAATSLFGIADVDRGNGRPG